MARTIAICNQKGGVGKSTTAINVSTYLALSNKKTLLIDLDPQSNATSGIGIDKHSVSFSIYNVLHEHKSLQEIIVNTQVTNLSIAPSNLDLTGAEVELVNAMSREYRLQKEIDTIKEAYDFIIIDCPPSLGLLTINALTAATSVLIPVQCEYYALEGLSQLMNTVNLIKDNLNNKLKIEGVLLSMADFRTNLTKEVIDEVKKFFGDKVYNTVIPRSIKLTEAPGFGKPIALYDAGSIGAKAYESLAKELLGNISQDAVNKEVREGENIVLKDDRIAKIEDLKETGNQFS
ncbi:MAG: ParA family protein [Candidatus Omnitrophica bacterium]|nr:ParA family protein [Candidatus Omnitrophota bacterium]